MGQSTDDVASLVDAVAAAAPEYAVMETNQFGGACLRISRSVDASAIRSRIVALAASSD